MTNEQPAHESTPAASSTAPYEVIVNAHEMFARKKYKESAALLLTLEGTPEFSSKSVQELLARSYYHSAQLTKAADVARGILDSNPTDVDAATILTRALERAGKAEEAAAARRLAESLGADI